MGLSEDKSILMGQKDGTGSYVYYYPITRDSEIIMSKESNGDTLEEFADLMTGGYARDNTKLPLTGGTVTGDAILKRGYYISSSNGGSSDAGYVKVATIQLKNNYANSPITLSYTKRYASYPTELSILFANSDSLDPELESFKYIGNMNGAWMYKSSTSTWDLYIQKDAYNTISILDVHISPQVSQKIDITWVTDSMASTVPSGAIQCTLTGKVLDSTNSANVNLTQSATDVSSHVWFSNGTTETARNADDDLTYNPSTNTLNVKSVKMDSAKWQFNSNTNSLDLVFV